MSECYPTGCTPCTSPIEFPESPVNGDRYCVPLGTEGEQKCWVYDKCIPGWRAEGPNTSPAAVYRGAINIKTEKPGSNIEAGHFYIQTETVSKPYQPEWGLTINAINTVVQNSRIAFNGQIWEVIPGPDVPYAEEARDGDKPDPDDRTGGIVKHATVNQALAGTDKCDTITPYTLKNVVDEEIGKLGIGDGKLEITVDGAKSTFTANQATGEVVAVEVGNGKVTFTQAGSEVGSITMNQTGDTTLDFTDNVSGPNAEIPGQFAALVNGTGAAKFLRGFSSWGKVSKGEYRFNFAETQPGASQDNVMVQATAGKGMPAIVIMDCGCGDVTPDYIQITTGSSGRDTPFDTDYINFSAWRIV